MGGMLLTTEVLTEKTAASKARLDVLVILQQAGYSVFALPHKMEPSNMMRLWRELSLIARKDAHIIIEYPFKARWRLYAVYLMSRLRRIKLYGIIHDIGSLRKQTASAKDMVVVRLFDGLISHNSSMTAWLRRKGFKRKIVNLELFDYLLKDHKSFAEPSFSDKLKVLYAGHLGYNKATYIYDNRFSSYQGVELSLYGEYLQKERLNKSSINYKGVFNPDAPDLQENYHFGLIWEGTSSDTCKGAVGEYIRYNNPHKFSLYIAMGLPVIAWKEAAIAPFIRENQIGLTINSLDDLSNLHRHLDQQTYQQFKRNISRIAEKVRTGYFLKTAVQKLTS